MYRGGRVSAAGEPLSKETHGVEDVAIYAPFMQINYCYLCYYYLFTGVNEVNEQHYLALATPGNAVH